MLDPTITVSTITGLFGTVGIILTGKLGSGKEQRAARKSAEAQVRSLDDYAKTCRAALEKAGEPVPPWPAELTDSREGD